MMTLEEAIKHCKDVALSCTNKECALEHFQLLKWLQEYSNMLEKQGEQESTDPDILIQQRVDALADIVAEQKPADKVEPKFHEGKWITNGDYTWKIVEVKPLDYILQSQEGNIVDDTISHVDEQFHSFTIKDAKDGDVLYHSDSASNGIFIFKELFEYEFGKKVICYCDYDSEDHFCLGEHHTCCWANAKILQPATKEQRDLLFSKMKEAGYEWNTEKKEVKKIEQEPAWSEEDENRINRLIAYFEDKESFSAEDDMAYANWLKSLKDRIQSKQEWSEEDETYSGLVITA